MPLFFGLFFLVRINFCLTRNQIFILTQTMNALIRRTLIRRVVNLHRGGMGNSAVRSLQSRSTCKSQQKPSNIFATMSQHKTNITTPFKITSARSEFFWKRIKQALGMEDPKEQFVKEEAEFEKKFAGNDYS